MKRFLQLSIALALLLSMALASKAQDEYSKVFDKEFAASNLTTLFVKNKYGQINVENWDRNSISIHVNVTVEHVNSAKAKTLLDAIDVVFSQNGNDVSAVTQFDEDIMKNSRKLFSSLSDQELSIDYKIMMPKNVSIDILHKYGDIYMAEFTNKVRVELKYGNINIKKLTRGDSDVINTLILAYAGAEIDEVNWLKLDVRYGSGIEVDKARALVIYSRYSKFEIGNLNSLVIDSKYDDFSIGTISNVVSETGYSSLAIEKVLNKMMFTSKYGDIKVNEVPADFSSIEFRGDYTGFKAGISSKASYNIDARASYSSIKYYAPVSRVNRIEGNTSTEINGSVGSVENPASSVYIRTKYGNVNLMGY